MGSERWATSLINQAKRIFLFWPLVIFFLKRIMAEANMSWVMGHLRWWISVTVYRGRATYLPLLTKRCIILNTYSYSWEMGKAFPSAMKPHKRNIFAQKVRPHIWSVLWNVQLSCGVLLYSLQSLEYLSNAKSCLFSANSLEMQAFAGARLSLQCEFAEKVSPRQNSLLCKFAANMYFRWC